jgi:hypothetical protein
MPPLIAHLSSAFTRRPGRSPGRRAMAIALVVALVSSSVAPGWALAAESESEAEGTAPHGLNNPAFEPGGEEAVLENLPGLSGSEENGEGPPVESEPEVQPELPETPAPVGAEAEPTTAAPSTEVTPPVEPPPPAPEAEPAPDYQASAPSSPPVEPIENEPLVAPPPESAPAPIQDGGNRGTQAEGPSPETVVEAPAPVAPVEPQAPAPEEPAPVAVAPDPASSGGGPGLSPASSNYTVRPGDCLWSIAERVLPNGASNAEVESEVARLWRLNADRIGTGDPNLILTGTVLRLH